MRTFALMAMATFLWIACQSNPKPESAKYDFTVKVGESFSIDLQANPSTGYSWQWIKGEKASIVELTETTYTSSAKPGIVGAGGTSTLRFKAKSKGRETIHLEYLRPWEKGAKAAKVATYEIEVK